VPSARSSPTPGAAPRRARTGHRQGSGIYLRGAGHGRPGLVDAFAVRSLAAACLRGQLPAGSDVGRRIVVCPALAHRDRQGAHGGRVKGGASTTGSPWSGCPATPTTSTPGRDDLGQRQGRRAGQPVPRHHRQVHQGETFLLTFADGPLAGTPGGGRGAVCTVAFARASGPRAAVGEPARSRRSCRRGCSGCPRPGRAGRRCTGRARIHRACRGDASAARRNCRRGPRS
jgi:hypothetical protein